MFIRFTLALLVIFSFLPAGAGSEQALPQRVLFVGNSYLTTTTAYTTMLSVWR